MNNKLTKLVFILTALAQIANADSVDIKLLDDRGKHLEGNWGCEWRLMNEDGSPHKDNPFFGKRFVQNLPSGTRWIVSVNCGNAGSGSHQIISSHSKEDYVIQLHKFQ